MASERTSSKRHQQVTGARRSPARSRRRPRHGRRLSRGPVARPAPHERRRSLRALSGRPGGDVAGRIYATPEEHAALRADLERYRRFDTTLHGRSGPDEKGRLEPCRRWSRICRSRAGREGPRAAGPATLTLVGALILARRRSVPRGPRAVEGSLRSMGAAGRRAAGARAGIRSAGVDSKASEGLPILRLTSALDFLRSRLFVYCGLASGFGLC